MWLSSPSYISAVHGRRATGVGAWVKLGGGTWVIRGCLLAWVSSCIYEGKGYERNGNRHAPRTERRLL